VGGRLNAFADEPIHRHQNLPKFRLKELAQGQLFCNSMDSHVLHRQ
jgi:hypothetical protein